MVKIAMTQHNYKEYMELLFDLFWRSQHKSNRIPIAILL